MSQMPIKLPALIYDDQCTMCTRFKMSLEFLDLNKSINFVPLHDPKIQEQYPELTIDILKESVHFVSSEGVIYKGSEAVSELIKNYPGVSKFAWLLDSDQGKKTMAFFYEKLNELKNKITEDCNTCGKKP
jgi:predicted DCC family thiol-disulfide oxidoreductase YuxK